MSFRRATLATVAMSFFLGACAPSDDTANGGRSDMQALVDQYATVRLTSDLSHLNANDREVVRLLIEAVRPMEDIFWMESYGDRADALALAGGDAATRRFIEINYGPWDRLRENEPFVDGVGAKPDGAQRTLRLKASFGRRLPLWRDRGRMRRLGLFPMCDASHLPRRPLVPFN